jgi:TP901 family phage tail tape measure protein
MTDLAALGLSVTSDGMVVATDRLKDFEKASERAAQGATRTERRSDALSAGLRRLAGVAAGVAGSLAAVFGGRAMIDGIANFDHAMARVGAITRATDADLVQLRETASTLGATTEFTAGQAADGLAFLGMAGFSAAESIAAIPSVLDLATASGMGLAEAADTASNIMSAFGIQAQNASDVTDILAAASTRANTNVQQLGQAISTAGPVAATLGIALEDTAAAIGVMSDAGIQGERAGTALRAVMASLAGPTTAARDALANYGLTAADVDVQTHGLAQVLETLQAAGLSTADAMAIFGREAASGALVMVQGAGRVREFGDELRNVDGAARDMAATMRDTLRGDLNGLSSAIGALIIAIGDAGLTGVLRGTVQAFTEVVRVIADNVEPAFNALLIVTSGLVATQLPALILALGRLPALFMAAGGAVGVFNAALSLSAGLLAAIGGPVSIVLALLGGGAAALFLYRDRIGELIQPTDEVTQAQTAMNAAMAVFHESAAPTAAAAAIDAANAYREQAAAARDAAESELARVEAMLASQAQMGMDPEAALFLGGQQSQAIVALNRANAALTAATTHASLAVRQVTGTMSEEMTRAANAARTVTVEVEGLGVAIDNLPSGSGAVGPVDKLTTALDNAAKSSFNLAEGLAGVFTDALTGARSLEDGIKSLLRQMATLFLNQAFTRLLGGILPGGGMINFGGFREAGGPVQAGRAYVVGEKRPELFVPGQSGTIIPQVPSAGGGTSIQIINTTGAPVREQRTRGPDGRELVKIVVGEELAGGGFDKQMGRFGVAPATVQR